MQRATRHADEPPAQPAADPALEFIRVLWSVDHELQRLSKRMVNRLGLTAPQRLAVRFIGRHPHLTLGRLADLLHVNPGTVTGIVRHLVSNGLATRTRGAEDTRRVHVTLTAAGRALDRRRQGTVEGAVRHTLRGASRSQLAVASRLMERLAADLARA